MTSNPDPLVPPMDLDYETNSSDGGLQLEIPWYRHFGFSRTPSPPINHGYIYGLDHLHKDVQHVYATPSPKNIPLPLSHAPTPLSLYTNLLSAVPPVTVSTPPHEVIDLTGDSDLE
jgi:hypothetical protein